MNKKFGEIFVNILYLTKEFPPDTGWGGIGTYTHLTVNEISKHVDNVVVLTSTPKKTKIETHDNITIYRIHKSGIPEKRILYPFYVFFDLVKIIKKHKIDLIETPEVNAELFFYQFLKGVFPKTVVRFHTPTFMLSKLSDKPPSFLDKLTSYMEKQMVLKADALTSPTKDLAKICTETWGLTKKVEIIPNGIVLPKKTNPQSAKNEFVLFMGRLEKRKGVELLAEAIPFVLKKHPNTKFVFMGKDTESNVGKMSERLTKIAKNTTNLTFTGYVTNAEKDGLIKRATCVVLPSVWENFPYVCLEAMSNGKVVIATNVGGFKEIITDKVDGFLTSQDTTSLANTILFVLDHPKLRRLVGKNVIVTTKRYNIELMVKATVEFYKKVIS